ncbi:MAG: hypothetical protein IMZ53_01445 [Thermoplasmata archaeon]|nr:hypothetical protein [Thermoplasmata archaeon]MBE3139227.1 hypothetical protein [Thermoplasmata archaeon]
MSGLIERAQKLMYDKTKGGEKPPFVMVVSRKEVEIVLHEINAYGTYLSEKGNEIDKVMVKVPGFVGKIGDVYIIQSFIDREKIKTGEKAIECMEALKRATFDDRLTEQTKGMMAKDIATYYKEHEDE